MLSNDDQRSSQPSQGPSEEDFQRLLDARERLIREDQAVTQLSDAYKDAQDRADRAVGTLEEEQAQSEAIRALDAYDDAAEKFEQTMQIVTDLMNLFY